MRETFAFMAPWRELTCLRSAANACEPDLTRCREDRQGQRGVFTQKAYRTRLSCNSGNLCAHGALACADFCLGSAANAHQQDLTPCREERQGQRGFTQKAYRTRLSWNAGNLGVHGALA
jgi:hypothetical protein